MATLFEYTAKSRESPLGSSHLSGSLNNTNHPEFRSSSYAYIYKYSMPRVASLESGIKTFQGFVLYKRKLVK